MIISGLLIIAGFILTSVISVFPVSTGFPTEVTTSISTLAGYVALINVLLPVPTLATIIGLLVSVEIAVFGFKTFKWLISHIPFVGGRG